MIPIRPPTFFRRREEPEPPAAPRPTSPYERYVIEEMILRDHLAVDRSSLANERTFLAYVRTALASIIGGVSVMHFLSGLTMELFGIALVAGGIVAGLFGLRRFLWYRRRIARVQGRAPFPAHPLTQTAAPPPIVEPTKEAS